MPKKRRFPRWQKVWFIISVVCLAAVLVLGLFRQHVVRSLSDQNEAERWTQGSGRAAQVSCFYASGSALTQESVLQLNYTINNSLTAASMKAAGDGAGLFMWCASGVGSTQIDLEDKESSVTAIGVLGDFFEFHQFQYLSGGPFLTDSEMKDQIVIDEYTAWRLFGSDNVVGQTVQIGGVDHLISGVIRRPSGYFARQAGISDSTSICIMSYKSLLQYTSESSDLQDSDQNGQNSDQNGQNSNESDGDSGGDSQSPQGRIDPDPALRAGRVSVLDNLLSVPVQAADTNTDTASEGSGGGDGQEQESTADTGSGDTQQPAQDDGSADTQETSAQTEDTAGGAQPSGSTAATASESGTEAPAAQSTQESAQQEGIGTQNTDYTDSGRISCYEAVMPEPVDGFALGIVRKNAGSSSDVSVVDNSSRYTTASLLGDLRGFTQRGMMVTGYALPYWENIARGWETVLSMVVLFQILLLSVVILFVIFVIVYYFRHKTWTATGTFAKIKDRIYDRQSRARYGKGQKIEGLSTLSDDLREAGESDKNTEDKKPDPESEDKKPDQK